MQERGRDQKFSWLNLALQQHWFVEINANPAEDTIRCQVEGAKVTLRAKKVGDGKTKLDEKDSALQGH